MVITQVLTADDLEAMGAEGERYEIIRGVLREIDGMGLRHGSDGGRLHGFLWMFVWEHGLGEIFTSDTRFELPGNPPPTLAPDISFVRADRLPAGDIPAGIGRLAPDLVVEIASPSNTEADILEKISAYLTGGVRLVWLVRPERRTVTVFRPDAPEVILGEGETLDGGDVLPGFNLRVADIFRRRAGPPR